MPDERLDSILQGIGVPPESQVGQEADRQRQKRLAESPPLEGGIGGTSDAETAPDEAQMNAALSMGAKGKAGPP